MHILGISCLYHDSAACILRDGKILAAAQEERFTRVKHDPRFPRKAIQYCMDEAGISADSLDYVVFYDKPFLTFERLLMSYLTVAPKGIRSWLQSMPLWLRQKLDVPKMVRRELGFEGEVLFTEHHEAHAASAFYPSPFADAAILTVDGVGEWATASLGFGSGNSITLIKELHFPDSLGLLYSAFTYYTGFKVNSGEYKLMGLAPYGEPRYKDVILRELVDVKQDGSLRLNLKYFDFIGGLRMTSKRFDEIFEGPPRKPEADITQREMDIAASVQAVTEEVVLKMAQHVFQVTRQKSICLAGGVALNCVANGRLQREGPFERIWIQPAAGDAGGALGAAFSVWHRFLGNDRFVIEGRDQQQGSYLGPSYSNETVKRFLETNGYPYHIRETTDRAKTVAEQISTGKIVGYMVGRMEFGPRSLGARSILGDPRRVETQTVMNLKIKHRESFRPFAPVVLEEEANKYFSMGEPSPYMLLVAYVREERRRAQTHGMGMGMMERLKVERSDIPAVTHLDYSARVQTVNAEVKSDFYDVIAEFQKLTGCAVLVNTSFNVRGEPIVCTPEDAYQCFMSTDMDLLVLENFILFKEEQPHWNEKKEWHRDFILD